MGKTLEALLAARIEIHMTGVKPGLSDVVLQFGFRKERGGGQPTMHCARGPRQTRDRVTGRAVTVSLDISGTPLNTIGWDV